MKMSALAYASRSSWPRSMPCSDSAGGWPIWTVTEAVSRWAQGHCTAGHAPLVITALLEAALAVANTFLPLLLLPDHRSDGPNGRCILHPDPDNPPCLCHAP